MTREGVSIVSRKTRRQIAKLRAEAMRQQRESFKWLSIRWGVGCFVFWTAICALVFVGAVAGALSVPGLGGYERVAILVGPIWFAASYLADRATRPVLGWYLTTGFGQLNYDFYGLWMMARGKGTKSARRELRRLCEEGTRTELDATAKCIAYTPEVAQTMDRLYGQAEQLSKAIVAYEEHRPADPKVVEANLRKRLSDEAQQIERDRVLALLRGQNEIAASDERFGITTTAQDIIDELRGRAAGNQEVAEIAGIE